MEKIIYWLADKIGIIQDVKQNERISIGNAIKEFSTHYNFLYERKAFLTLNNVAEKLIEGKDINEHYQQMDISSNIKNQLIRYE